MPELPQKKYLIIGGVITVILIITIVLLAVLLPADNSNNGGSTTTTANPVESTTPEVEETEMLLMLDSMQQLMEGDGVYDRVFYNELRQCMAMMDSRLQDSQDGAWKGMIDYWLSHGAKNDPWGGYETHYIEQDMKVSNMENMTIYEPCNYASNMATYHPLTEICQRLNHNDTFSFSDEYVKSIGATYAALAYGSSLMHGSHTWLGHLMDNAPIGVLSYLIHQGSISPLEGASSILTDFSQTPRNQTALELADEFVNIYRTMPVEQWYRYTGQLDIPDYYYTFAAITTTALELVFEPDVVEEIILTLASAFSVPDDLVIFITDQYIPEFRNLTKDIQLGTLETVNFSGNLVSSLIKLLYAFLWQEQRLTDNEIFFDPEVNKIGWELLPMVNGFANSLNHFTYYETDFQNGTGIYPGEDSCNPKWPHAKWHLESAIGLLDLTYLGDEVHRLLSK